MFKKLCLALMAVALTACSSKETLLRDLSERDANEIVAVLYTNAISSDKQADAKGKTFTVTVDKSELAKSIAVLRAVGLPREARPSINDVFKSSGFAPTPFEERVRFIYGVSQELERTLSYMNGVMNARVHVVIPEKVSRHQTQAIPSASVFISYDDRTNFELEIPKVRKLVAESIEGLSQDNIEVVATPTRVDLSKLATTPVTNIAGIRVHQDDFPILFTFVALWIAVLAFLGYHFRREIQAQWQKFKAKVGK